jgi:hypothetical protein
MPGSLKQTSGEAKHRCDSQQSSRGVKAIPSLQQLSAFLNHFVIRRQQTTVNRHDGQKREWPIGKQEERASHPNGSARHIPTRYPRQTPKNRKASLHLEAPVIGWFPLRQRLRQGQAHTRGMLDKIDIKCRPCKYGRSGESQDSKKQFR